MVPSSYAASFVASSALGVSGCCCAVGAGASRGCVDNPFIAVLLEDATGRLSGTSLPPDTGLVLGGGLVERNPSF